MLLPTPKGILRMAELVGLLVFVALAIAGGMAIAPYTPPALGWLFGAVLTLTMAAGLLYVGGIVFQLPMSWLGRTRLGRALASDQAKDIRRTIAVGYWGVLIVMAAGMLALEHFLGRQ
jgi:hypothetical protein